MKTSLLALLFLSLLNCGSIDDLEQPTPIVQIIVIEKPTPVVPPVVEEPKPIPVVQKAVKRGSYFLDPITGSLCEKRDDIVTKYRPDLAGKCLPVKTSEYKSENTCRGGSDRFFIDVANTYIKDIKITEKDGKFYEAQIVKSSSHQLYQGSYFGPSNPTAACTKVIDDASIDIFLVYPGKEINPTFSNLP